MRSGLYLIGIFALCLLLVAPAMAQTEDEMVARFFQKAEKRQVNKVGFFVINGSFGRLNRDNDYNKFVVKNETMITSLDGEAVKLDKINSSGEFFAGFGVMTSPKSSAVFGFNYWLKLGSSYSGDFNLSQVNLGASDADYDFTLKSEIQVYGITGNFDYFILSPPDKNGNLKNLGVKVGLGGGYYWAKWEIWDGFTGYNLNTSTAEIIEGKLEGSAPGVMAGISAEYPIQFGGLVMEGSLKYLYLNFTGMKWYNQNNEEAVATVNNSGAQLDLNLSGPRAQLGLKRYFSW